MGHSTIAEPPPETAKITTAFSESAFPRSSKATIAALRLSEFGRGWPLANCCQLLGRLSQRVGQVARPAVMRSPNDSLSASDIDAAALPMLRTQIGRSESKSVSTTVT